MTDKLTDSGMNRIRFAVEDRPRDRYTGRFLESIAEMTDRTMHRNDEQRLTRMCDHKVKYRNKSDAKLAAVRAHIRNDEPFVAYQCVRCGFWHIGHDKETAQAVGA